VVEGERCRLLDRRIRSSLAASLEDLVRETANPHVMVGPPLFDRVVVRSVAAELLQVAKLLRGEPSSARGVALVWRLICEGATSPLHRANVAELREELARIRYVLRTNSVGNQPADGLPRLAVNRRLWLGVTHRSNALRVHGQRGRRTPSPSDPGSRASPADAAFNGMQKGSPVMNEYDDAGARDFRFGVTGMLLMIVAALLLTLLS
jgi:hypothetical protein